MTNLVYLSDRIRAMSNALSVPDGGFSVDPHNGSDIHVGYAVAAHPEHMRVLDGPVSDNEIHEFIVRSRDALALPGRVLGGWRDPRTGHVHLDVSVVTVRRSDAVAIARTTRQLAIFDLAGMRSCRARWHPQS